ncbi:MAG: hypothetical protein P1V97_22870 [Planctomycetota bacterium]|nr:hypothetical protein [Planctomycetota bacterium]
MYFQFRALFAATILGAIVGCGGGGSGGGGNPPQPVSGRFEINSPSRTEGNNGQTQFNFLVTLSDAQTDTVKVIADTKDLSAISISGGSGSSDFTSLSNVELIFLPVELNKVVSVFANADLVD